MIKTSRLKSVVYILTALLARTELDALPLREWTAAALVTIGNKVSLPRIPSITRNYEWQMCGPATLCPQDDADWNYYSYPPQQTVKSTSVLELCRSHFTSSSAKAKTQPKPPLTLSRRLAQKCSEINEGVKEAKEDIQRLREDIHRIKVGFNALVGLHQKVQDLGSLVVGGRSRKLPKRV